MSYSVGDLIAIDGVWTDSNSAATDPAVVRCQYKDPSGNVTTLTYPTDAALVRDGVGVYHADIDADEAGTWHYRFYSTGTGQGANEESFHVKPSRFVP